MPPAPGRQIVFLEGMLSPAASQASAQRPNEIPPHRRFWAMPDAPSGPASAFRLLPARVPGIWQPALN